MDDRGKTPKEERPNGEARKERTHGKRAVST